MKRPLSKDSRNRQTITGDIKRDLSAKQLAEIGAISLAFNEVEKYLEVLFFMATDLSGPLQYEVSTRINGMDGKIEIIKIGIAQFGLSRPEIEQFNELLGRGVFGLYKSFRDAIIHARITDGAVGIGTLVGRRATISEVLLSQEALSTLYEHLVALTNEIQAGMVLIGLAKTTSNLRQSEPGAEQVAQGRQRFSTRFRGLRATRLALRPIPQFPSEAELDAAATRWQQERQAEMAPTGDLLGWMQQWAEPQRPRQMSPALHAATTGQTGPVSFPQEEKKG